MIALLSGGLLLGGPASAETSQLLKAESNISGGALSKTALWFTLDWINVEFFADPAKTANAEALFQAVKDASTEGRSVAVWYDPDTASIDRDKWLPVFVVRRLVAGGKTFPGDEKTAAEVLPASASAVEIAENALARGIAYSAAGQPKVALPLLDKALAEAGLAPQLRLVGLKARAQLREGVALADFPAGEARDQALIGALEDGRAWSAAAPDDSYAAFQNARVLTYLGGYQEALAIYQDGLLRWPDQSYRVMRGFEAVYRDMGKLKEASEWLDKLGELPDAKNTMPYRYHRGWLLDEMGQYEAAIAEYSEGMKVQPDYDGAFWRRSCAYAATGQIEESLGDYLMAKKLRETYLQGAAPSTGADFDAKRYAEVGQILMKTLAEDPHRKVTGLCQGYWDWGDEPRQRSKLLPPSPGALDLPAGYILEIF